MQDLVPEEQAHAVSAVHPSGRNQAGASAANTPIPASLKGPPGGRISRAVWAGSVYQSFLAQDPSPHWQLPNSTWLKLQECQ